jgi:hypothetical protein
MKGGSKPVVVIVAVVVVVYAPVAVAALVNGNATGGVIARVESAPAPRRIYVYGVVHGRPSRATLGSAPCDHVHGGVPVHERGHDQGGGHGHGHVYDHVV